MKETGLYHVKSGDQDILTLVGPMNAPEFGDMLATTEKLSPIIKASGGGSMWLADQSDGPDIKRISASASTQGWGWIGLRQNGQYRITGSKAYPLWPAWLALAILLAFMVLAWRREGKG